MHYLFALSWRVFDQAIYIYLISCWVKSNCWVELSSWIVESNFSIQFEFLSSTSQFNSTLFQKNFNLTWYFLSRVLDLNSNTRLDAISLLLIFQKQKHVILSHSFLTHTLHRHHLQLQCIFLLLFDFIIDFIAD